MSLLSLRRRRLHAPPRRAALLALASLATVVSGCAAEETTPVVAPPPPQAVAVAPVVTPVAEVAPPATRAQPGIVTTTGGDPAWANVPTMPYSHFLPNSQDEGRRQQFWTLFQRAEQEARQFPSSPSKWVPLVLAEYVSLATTSGEWSPDGHIELKPENQPGVMFHEIFHTVYHLSELKTPGDGRWTEAWCDAFRYAAEKELLPTPSNWVPKMTKITTQSEADFMGDSVSKWKTNYAWPAALIIKRSGGTMAGLHALWVQLLAQKRARGGTVPIQNEFFGYVVP
jgi:hypothetical protein